MSNKISKSEKIRQALTLKSNKHLSVVELAEKLNVKPGLIYALKWKAKNGKANRKTQKQAFKGTNAGVGAAIGVNSGTSLVPHGQASAALSEAKSTSTITDMILTLQEALLVLQKIRGIVG